MVIQWQWSAEVLLINLKSWSPPPPLLLGVNHSGFPFFTFTRWLGRLVGLTHPTKCLEKGIAHLGLFDTCEIRALFWSNHLDFLLQKSGGVLLSCEHTRKLICLNFSLSVCSLVFFLNLLIFIKPFYPTRSNWDFARSWGDGLKLS